MRGDADPFLRRLERNSLLACGAMAVVAALIRPGDVRVPLGVLAGGVLAAVSYRGIKAGIDALLGSAVRRPGERGPGILWPLVKFFTRYAILAVAAYVMLARLRLPPWAVAAGASSLVVAVAIAAVRAFGSVSRPGNPR